MGFSLNEAKIIGNLGQDPEIRNTDGGSVVATLSIATNEKWKDRDGETKERTEWHRVVLFGRVAEVARDYAKKGTRVFVSGRIQTREWEDKEGQRRWTTEIVGFSFGLLGGDGERGGGSHERDEPSRSGGGGGGGGGGRDRGDSGRGRERDDRGGSSSRDRGRDDRPPASSSREPGVDDDDDIPF